MRFPSDPIVKTSALQQTNTMLDGSAGPAPVGAPMQPACTAVQSPLCQTALQLTTADNSRGTTAHPGGDVTAAAQLQYADAAALQQKAVLVSQLQSPAGVPQLQDLGCTAQLQRPGSAAQLTNSGKTSQLQLSSGSAQLQLSSGSAQLQLSGGQAQLQSSGGTAQLLNSGSQAQLHSPGCSAQLQQKLHPAEVQISAVAQKQPLQRHSVEPSAEPMLSQQAAEEDPTEKVTGDEGDPTCRPGAEEHAPRYIAGMQMTHMCYCDIPAELLHH